MKVYANLEKISQSIKDGTKTVWQTDKVEKKTITKTQYQNITNPETLRFFRSIGGSATATKAYTAQGFRTVKLISTSPNRQSRTIYSFDLEAFSPTPFAIWKNQEVIGYKTMTQAEADALNSDPEASVYYGIDPTTAPEAYKDETSKKEMQA